ncbi:hypothetical protein ACP8WO_29780, partial [Klebsiella pneumoniae]
GPQNDVTLKMPAFEWVHVQLHQQKGMISLSPPTICNSALDVINRIVTEAKEIPFMEDGAEVLAKAQYQLTLTYEEFLQLTAAKDSYDKHLEKIQKKTQSNNI